MAAAPAPKVRVVRCPACGGDSLYAPANAFRPFCSERCKNRDFGAWASEGYRVASTAPTDADDEGAAGAPPASH